MKWLLIHICLLTLLACNQTPDKIMKAEIKKYVDNNFHDPKSYEPISLEVQDTLFWVDSLRMIVSEDSLKIERIKEVIQLEKETPVEIKSIIANAERLIEKDMKEKGIVYTKPNLESQIVSIRSHIDSCLVEIQKTSPNKIAIINYLHKYRAKNAVGALNLSGAIIVFNE